MRVLLDACVPRRLRRQLPGHEVRTVPEMGWGDLDDGTLLEAIAGRFDVLITVDKGIPKQQRLEGRAFAVIVLHARTNRLSDLLPLIPALRESLDTVQSGETREIEH